MSTATRVGFHRLAALRSNVPLGTRVNNGDLALEHNFELPVLALAYSTSRSSAAALRTALTIPT